MARSLKSNYLLLAVGVSAILLLILAAFAYYERRLNAADANQLTYVTVEQKLEADLEARANSVSNATRPPLAPALRQGNSAAVATIAARLLDERDIERVEVLDAHSNVLYSGSNPAAQPSATDPFVHAARRAGRRHSAGFG